MILQIPWLITSKITYVNVIDSLFLFTNLSKNDMSYLPKPE